MTDRTERDLWEQWGAEIRRLRTERGMTQYELAAAAGIDQATLSRLERGVAGGSAMCRIGVARAFGVEVHQLFAFPSTAEVAS